MLFTILISQLRATYTNFQSPVMPQTIFLLTVQITKLLLAAEDKRSCTIDQPFEADARLNNI
jgi:hypothetical protein